MAERKEKEKEEASSPLQLSTTEAVIAVAFLMLIIGLMYGVMTGLIASPIVAGLGLVYAVLVLLFGLYLMRAGRISMQGLVVYFVLVAGITLFVFGMVQKGMLPVARIGTNQFEIISTTTMLYILAGIAIVTILVALYLYSKQKG